MKCDELNDQLDDYIDHRLSDNARAEFEAHMESCAACCGRVARALSLQNTLRSLETPPMPQDMAERLFRRVAEEDMARRAAEKQPDSRVNRLLKPGLAAAVMLGLLLGWGLFSPGPERAGLTEWVLLDLNDVREVQFAVNARDALEGVTLTLRIPDNTELVGYPDQRELTWTTDLRQGPNLLSLPLRGARAGQGEVVVMIDTPSGRQTQKVLWVDTAHHQRSDGIPMTLETPAT
ncbi:zf-HC2 domain-containing protein [Alcanivorax sp. JB21]|uniref:anti-sigma factor family protein n=1 Tax=Alcanivorax limicola TaxID=2874102 RepID=UPI001CBCCFC3|nr:zf-HC2 domain-containing protein [Alcanivorax limicola]MBZ2188968.1 zf-HC2 domain-containing protein [Alcanivorax limicola]